MSGDPRKFLPVGFLREEREREAKLDTPVPTSRPHLEHRLANAVDLDHDPTIAACLEALEALPADARAEAVSRPLPQTGDDHANHPLLVVAAAAGRADLVRRFLAWGADVDAKNERGSTALACACHTLARSDAADTASAALALIEAGADVEAVDFYGMRPLHHAAAAGSVPVIGALLAAGASVDAFDPDERGTTPLFEAAEDGHAEAVRTLLAAGATVDEPPCDDWTPLLAAAARGHGETVAVLLRAGANAARRDDAGRSGLHFAARHGDLDIVRQLAAAGADLTAPDEAGATPEDILIAFGDDALLAELGRRGALRRGIPEDRRILIFCHLVLQNVPGRPEYDDRFSFAGLLHERELWLVPRARRLAAAIRGLGGKRPVDGVLPTALAAAVHIIYTNTARSYFCSQAENDGFTVTNIDRDTLHDEFPEIDFACGAFFQGGGHPLERLDAASLAAFEEVAREVGLGSLPLLPKRRGGRGGDRRPRAPRRS